MNIERWFPVLLLGAIAVACGGSQDADELGGALAAGGGAVHAEGAGLDGSGEAAEAAAAPLDDPADAPSSEETLILDGTPEIPDEMRDRLNPYLNTRSASIAALSDDGEQVLIRTRFAETYQLHRLMQPMGARTQLTFLQEPVSAATFVPGRTDQLVFRSDIGGTEEYQLFELDLTTGVQTELTPPGVRAGSALFSDDGTRTAFSRNVLGEPNTEVWVMNGTDASTAHPIMTNNGYWYPMDFSDDGDQLLVGRYVSVTESEVFLVDVTAPDENWDDAGGPPADSIQRVTPESSGAYPYAMFTADPDVAVVMSDRGGEFVQLWRWPLDGGEPESLTEDIPWNVEDMALAPDGETLAFAVNEGGFSRIYVHDLGSNERRIVESIPDGIVYGMQFAREAPVLGLTFNSATSPGDVYTVDLRADEATRWTQSEVGGLNPDGFVAPTLIDYPTFDDRAIPAFYYAPDGDGPHPVVVNIHGGPESQARPYFSATIQYLVREMGVAVLVPNVRGSDGYGRSYLGLDNGMLREDSVRDIGALLDWIAAQAELDADRVGVLGGSYGGYMVLASLMHYSDRLAGGVNVVGISNFVTFLENTREYRQDLRRAEYGDERVPEMRDFLVSISPTENVDRIQAPLFVAQGANDPRVPVTEAEQIVDAVRSTGRDVWYMLAMNEGHGFARKENRDTFTLLTLMFFERHLLSP